MLVKQLYLHAVKQIFKCLGSAASEVKQIQVKNGKGTEIISHAGEKTGSLRRCPKERDPKGLFIKRSESRCY